MQMPSVTSQQSDIVDLKGVCNLPPLTKGSRKVPPFTKERLGEVISRPPLSPPSQGGEHSPPNTLVGATADKILRSPGFTGRVIMVGGKAAFVVGGQSLMLAFSQADQQPHPRAVLSNLDLRAISVGMPVRVCGEDVIFGGGETLSLGQMPPWRRKPLGPGSGLCLGNVSRGFERVLDAALAMHQGENLGLVLPDIAAGSTTLDLERPAAPSSPLIAGAMEQIRRIVPVCRSERIDLALAEAETLIGLGPGLTPSGDDFVGGLLFAAYHLKEAFPERLTWDVEAVAGLIGRACSMTNSISHALLSDFAMGQGYEAMHDLMDGMLTGDANFDAETHVIRVTKPKIR